VYHLFGYIEFALNLRVSTGFHIQVEEGFTVKAEVIVERLNSALYQHFSNSGSSSGSNDY
jgi:hypothetical protein